MLADAVVAFSKLSVPTFAEQFQRRSPREVDGRRGRRSPSSFSGLFSSFDSYTGNYTAHRRRGFVVDSCVYNHEGGSGWDGRLREYCYYVTSRIEQSRTLDPKKLHCLTLRC